MIHKDYKGIHVEADFDCSDQELDQYIRIYDTDEFRKLKSLELKLAPVGLDGFKAVDGDYIDVKATYTRVPFNRINRITGYLVPDVSRWNDGKKAERRDRTLHGGSRLGQRAYLD